MPRNVCLYVEPFTSYLASKLTILEKYSKMQHIWPIGKNYWRLPPRSIHFSKAFFVGNIASEIVCLYLKSLKNYKTSKLTMLKKYAKMQHISPYGLLVGYRFMLHDVHVLRKLSWSWCWALIDMLSCKLPFSRHSRSNWKTRCLNGKNGPPEPLSWPGIWRPIKYCHQKARRRVRNMALPSCKISCRSVALPAPPRYLSPHKIVQYSNRCTYAIMLRVAGFG